MRDTGTVVMNGPLIRAMFEPKDGSSVEEWEDSAAYDESRGLAAVADGAGSSYRAARWSSALTGAFVTSPPDLTPDLGAFRTWVAKVADGFQVDSEKVSDSTWYTSDASRRGSFATFVGIRLSPGTPMTLTGVQLGDACVFHTRGDELITAPITDPDSFDSTPDLLGSSPYGDSYGAERARFIHAAVEPGDVIFLTSDALGAAMLRVARENRPMWSGFAGLDHEGFHSVVDRLRSEGIMENDDVTMLRLHAPGDRS